MVESNKILTVSYGTFSCTLEGFDDAFDTMKAIAEYFRDLAADDRYFGAEPPTPDTEMLTRLAERNSARRVRARTEEGNIVLSPDSARPDPQPAETRPETVQPEAVQPEPRQPEAAPPEATPANPTPAAEVEAEEVAEDEMPPRPMRAPRIAAALAAAGDAALLAADDTLDPTPARTETAASMAPAVAPFSEAPLLPEQPAPARPTPVLPEIVTPAAPLAAAPVEATLSEALAEDHSEAPASEHAAEEMADIPETAPEALHDGEPPVAEAEDGSAPEDQPAPATISDIAGEAAQVAEAALPAAASASEAETADELNLEAATDLTPSGDGWDSIAEAEEAIAIARAEAEDGEDLPPASPAPTDVALKLQRIRDVVARHRAAARAVLEGNASPAPADPAASDATASEPAQRDAASADAPRAAEPAAATDVPETTPEAPAAALQEPPLPQPLRPMARVIKVKRRDADDAAAERGPDNAVEEAPASSLSAEEEDALQRELAAIEAEAHPAPLAPAAGQPDVQDPVADAPESPAHGDSAGQPARAGLAARSLRDTDHGAQMDRILRETDNHFEQEDSARRRSALAHLRAAVAAKKAEKAAGSDFAPREDTTDAYREDLAQVVRPRRPAIAHQSTSPARRGVPTRPAPLKLVAEQRIDVSGGAQGPVRPRRVSIADLARREDSAPHAATSAGAPDESFADYAAAVGARSLGELLEAAASYMSFMEHQPLFSRPQLMSRVKSLQAEGFSREDGLRAFGQLLREGKIRKAEAGRFSVSDSIGFRPEERAAG